MEKNALPNDPKELDGFLSSLPKNKDGYPERIPAVYEDGRRAFLLLHEVKVTDEKGNLIHVPSDLLFASQSHLSPSDPEIDGKLILLASLLSPKRILKGAVYYRGEYYADKLTPEFKEFLASKILLSYVPVEVGEALQEEYAKAGGGRLPYFPVRYDSNWHQKAMFIASHAQIQGGGDYDFAICQGEIFDAAKPSEQSKLDCLWRIFRGYDSLEGFYYKGKLLPEKLDKQTCRYLEKSFVKKNFAVEDRDYLLSHATKDPSGYPYFWAMHNKEGKELSISILDAEVSKLGFSEDYANFDVYSDKSLNPREVDGQKKVKVIEAVYAKKIKGALYLDGMLIPSDLSQEEVLRRKEKAELATGVYFSGEGDSLSINKDYSTADYKKLLHFSSLLDEYFPDDVTPIPFKDPKKGEEDQVLFRFDRVNAVRDDGEYVLDEPVSLLIHDDDVYERIKTKGFDLMVHELYRPNGHLRGAIYYGNKNALAENGGHLYKSFLKALEKFVPAERIAQEKKQIGDPVPYVLMPSGHLRYYPTEDRSHRDVLITLSEVSTEFYTGDCHRVNLDLYQGETFGLFGEPNMGKTAVSSALSLAMEPAKGAVYFKGKLCFEDRKVSGREAQKISLDPASLAKCKATALAYVEAPISKFKLYESKEELYDKAMNALTRAGFDAEKANQKVMTLSPEDRVKVAEAYAMAHEPELLLADDPSNSTPEIRDQAFSLLTGRKKKNGYTLVFVSHDLPSLLASCDRIGVMKDGYLLEVAPKEELLNHPIHPYTKSLIAKNEGKSLVYNQSEVDFASSSWLEVELGHFVLAKEEEARDWAKGIFDPKVLHE